MNAKRYFYLIASVLTVLLLAFAYQGVIRAFKAAIVIGLLFLAFKGYRFVTRRLRSRREQIDSV